MGNSIFDDFLDATHHAAQALAAESDVLELHRLPIPGEGVFIAEFATSYLAHRGEGRIEVASGPLGVLIHLGPRYLQMVSPLEVVQVRETDFFHSNFRFPVLCVGELRPGMPLPQLLRHIWEIVSYQNFATDDGLNPVACQRLRDEPELLDRLPRPPRLVRRRVELVAEPDAIEHRGSAYVQATLASGRDAVERPARTDGRE